MCLAAVALSLAGTNARAQSTAATGTPPASQPATAPDDAVRQQAAEHFRRGREHFERGEFEQGLGEITRSYELVPIPALLYNIGVTQRRLGDLDSAIQTFERYLATGGDAVSAERRAEVELVLAELRGSTVEVHLDIVAPAGVTPTLTVDQRPVPGPWTRTYRFLPGAHDAHATAPGMVAAHERFTLSRGPAVTVRLVLAPPSVTLGVLHLALTRIVPSTRVFIDGVPTDAWPRGLRLEAGPHSVRVEAEGYQPFRETVNVRAQESRSLAVTLQPSSPPPPPYYRHPLFWIGVGLATVGIAVGIPLIATARGDVFEVPGQRPTDFYCNLSVAMLPPPNSDRCRPIGQ